MRTLPVLALLLCALVVLAPTPTQAPSREPQTTVVGRAPEPKPAQVVPEINIFVSPSYYNYTDGYYHVPGKTNITISITPPEALNVTRSVDFCLWNKGWATISEYYDVISITPQIMDRGGYVEIEMDWGDPIFSVNWTLSEPIGDRPPEEVAQDLPYWEIRVNVTYVEAGTLKWKIESVPLFVHFMRGDMFEEYCKWTAPMRSMELGVRPRRVENIIPESPGYYRFVGRRFCKGVQNIYWIIRPEEAEAYEEAVYLYITPWDKPSEYYDLGGNRIPQPMDMTGMTKWGYWIAEANVKFGWWYGYVASWDTTTFPDGVYKIMVKVEDTYGNYMTYTIFVLVDNTVPKVAILSPSDGQVVSGVITVEFVINETNPKEAVISVDIAAKALSPGEFYSNGTVNTYALDTTSLGDGEHIIRIEVEDLSGNTNSTFITIEVNNVWSLLETTYNTAQWFGFGMGLAVGLAVGIWGAVAFFLLARRKE